MLLTTPETIRTLQRKLYAKANQETVFCSALHGRVRRRDILSRANKRRAGKCACLGVNVFRVRFAILRFDAYATTSL